MIESESATDTDRESKALQDSEALFRVTFEQAAVGLAHISPNGHFLRVNQKLCEILGFTQSELLAKTFQEITHPDDLEKDLQFVQQMLKAEIRTYSIEKRYIRKDTAVVWGNLSVSLVLDRHQQPKYFIGVIENISDRKRAEDSLQRYSQRVVGLHKIDHAILTEKLPKEISGAALSHLRRMVSCQQVMVILFDLDASEAKILAGDAQENLIFPEDTQFPLENFLKPVEQHINKVRHVSDLAVLDQPCPITQHLLAAGIHASLAVPLFVERHVIGELRLLDPRVAAFNSEHIDISCEVADHLAVAIQNVRLFERVQSDRERLQALSSRLLEAQELERRHIAHELHDEIGQALTAVKINLQVLQRSLNNSGIDYPLQDSVSIVNGALQQVRNLSLDLRPSLLDDLGLRPALEWYIERQMQRTGTAITLVYGFFELALPPKLETVCYRIVQEALTNIAKYAKAEHVVIQFRQSHNTLNLSIQDDGIGFDVQAARERAARGSSLGLLGMEERASLVGGRMSITSSLGQGTSIHVEFPNIASVFNPA